MSDSNAGTGKVQDEPGISSDGKLGISPRMMDIVKSYRSQLQKFLTGQIWAS
jgi:hypothetical protein